MSVQLKNLRACCNGKKSNDRQCLHGSIRLERFGGGAGVAAGAVTTFRTVALRPPPANMVAIDLYSGVWGGMELTIPAYVTAWVLNDQHPSCMLCAQKFGTTRRWRHHCRICGLLVCQQCSDHTVNIVVKTEGGGGQLLEKDGSRVCNLCHNNSIRQPREVPVRYNTVSLPTPRPARKVKEVRAYVPRSSKKVYVPYQPPPAPLDEPTCRICYVSLLA